jgi:hypothetical protein
MPKMIPFDEIKEALGNAMREGDDPFVTSSLETLTEVTEIVKEAQRQLEAITRMNRSITINARYHQGRAVKRQRSLGKKQKGIGLTTSEATMVERIYDLFVGHAHLIYRYYGKEEPFYRITKKNVIDLRAFIDGHYNNDRINVDLDEILDFRFEDESSFPSCVEDVAQGPENPENCVISKVPDSDACDSNLPLDH